jgi:hypothetical protein
VAPTAPIGSIIFTHKESLHAMQAMYDRYRSKIWGRYGFSNAFNVDRDWWDKDVIGIDLGMALLAIENYRTGSVWKMFLRRRKYSGDCSVRDCWSRRSHNLVLCENKHERVKLP